MVKLWSKSALSPTSGPLSIKVSFWFFSSICNLGRTKVAPAVRSGRQPGHRWAFVCSGGCRRDSAKGLKSWIMQKVRNALNKNSFWLSLLMEPGAQTCQPRSVSETPRSSPSVPAASCKLDPENHPAENSSLWYLSPYLNIPHPSIQRSFYLLMKGRKQTYINQVKALSISCRKLILVKQRFCRTSDFETQQLYNWSAYKWVSLSVHSLGQL